MDGPNKQGYWKACKTEIKTSESKDSLSVVQRREWMNGLPSTWAFKCKRFPYGSIRKLKARFCARGDRQIERKDYFETFATVVLWQSVCVMFILSILLGLETKQVDFTAAFVHAAIDKDTKWDGMTKLEIERSSVFIEIPRGFQEGGKVLKLQRSLYGLKQKCNKFL